MSSLNEKSGLINAVFDHLARLFCYLVPGIVLLEVVFEQGVFSTSPKTLYDFIIYILWATLISVPFNFSIPTPVKTYLEGMISYAYDEMERQNVNPERIDKKATLDEEERIRAGLILIKVVVFYLLYILLDNLGLVSGGFFEIPEKIIQVAIVLTIVSLLSYPLGLGYLKIIERGDKRATKKTIEYLKNWKDEYQIASPTTRHPSKKK